MEKKKMLVAAAFAGIVVVSLLVGAYAANTSAGKYQCGVFSVSYGWGTWVYLDDYPNWTTILSLSLPPIPIDAYYQVICDGYAGIDDCQIRIGIGVDAPIEDESTRRFYGDSSNAEGFDGHGIHTDRVYFLEPGKHTFYFLGVITSTTDPEYYADLNYMTITVVVYTDGSVTQLNSMTESELSIDGYAG
ncbi:MAG: hypothetical protein JSW53_01345 [Candidatus Bathyarchaeota archaeon]|nr:MAG: hypothetical protein JSW53_01345 [Candidatus Bathyarchaeota archaeon]